MASKRWHRTLAVALIFSLLAQTAAPISADWLVQQLQARFEQEQGLAVEADGVLALAQGAASVVVPSAAAAGEELPTTAAPLPLAPAGHDPGDTNSEATQEDNCKPANDCGSAVRYDSRSLVLQEAFGAAGLPLVATYDSRYETRSLALAAWIPTTMPIDNWEVKIEGWTFRGTGARPLAFWDTTNKDTGKLVPAGVYSFETTYGNKMSKGSTSHAVVVKRGEDGPLGFHRAHNFQSQVVPVDEGTVLLRAFGTARTFTRKSQGVYEGSNPTEGRLIRQADGSFAWERTGADGSGVSGVVKFDVQGRLAAFEDRLGNLTKLTYDAQGRLVAIADPVGRTTRLAYDGSHITSVTDAAGARWTLAYQNGDLIQITNPLGNSWRYAYDEGHRVTQKTDPRGNITRYAYDDQGAVKSVTDSAGNVVNFQTTYITDPQLVEDPSQNKPDLGLTTVVYANAEGKETSRRLYTFDDTGLITRLEVSGDGGKTSRVWQYTYGRAEKASQLQAIVDPAGGLTKYSYQTGTNLLTKVETPADSDVNFRYRLLPARGLNLHPAWVPVATSQTGTISESLLEYDAQGLLHRVQRGELEYWLQPAGDEVGLRGLTAALVWNWDGKGDPTANKDAKLVRYEYDRLGQVVATLDPLGQRTVFAYDTAGRLIKVTDPRGRSFTMEYDAIGHLIRQTAAAGGTTGYAYDANGNLSSMTDARGNTLTLAYDHKDRLVSQTDALGRALRFAYDNEGRLQWREDARGARVTFEYDPQGRMTGTTFPTGEKWEVAYDDRGRVTRAANQAAVWAFENDLAGRVTKATLTRGARTTGLAYKYDRAGRVTGLETSDGFKISYTYGRHGELKRVDSPLGDIVYEYATQGELAPRLTLVRYDQLSAQLNYDQLGRLSELTYHHARWPANRSLSYRYAYDSSSNVASVQDPTGTTTYAYDQLDRLTGVTYPGGDKVTYAYDTVGNRTKKTTAVDAVDYTYDAANQLLTAGATRFSYDADGHLVGAWQGEKGRVYAWDYQGQLKSVGERSPESLPYPLSLGSGGRDEPRALASYAYDALGQQVSQGGSAGTRDFLMDRSHVAQQYDEAGKPVSRSVYGNGWDDLAATDRGEGSAADFPYADALGTPDGTVDGKGEQSPGKQYDPWGAPLDNRQTDLGAGFQGRPYDPDTGLYQFRARFYDPAVGRFISPDPLSIPMLPGASNGYIFGLNNPMRFTDPTGQILPIIAAIVIGAAFGAVLGATYQSAKYAFSTPSECFRWGEFFYRMGTGALVGGVVGGMAGAFGFWLAGAGLSTGATVLVGGFAGGVFSALENVGEQKIVERRDSLNKTDVLIAWGAGTIGGMAGAGLSGFIGNAVGKEISTELAIASAAAGRLGWATTYAVTEPIASKLVEAGFTYIANRYKDAPTDLQSQGGGGGGN